MIRPSHLRPVGGLVALVLVLAAVGRGDDKPKPPPPPDPGPKSVVLPLTRVTLFTAGVGYFRREGTVEGDARTDLRFPEADVNDLIKSLVLTDANGGKVRAVTYDNKAPVEYTLKSFGVDLTDNPTVGQLLHQVRGEKVVIVDGAGAVLTGQIVSVEKAVTPPAGTVDAGEQLNLLTADGLQSVGLKQVKKVQFVKADMQDEFRKALEVLAAARGDSKKAVSVVFAGAGKRQVGVGYVVEAPIWKATYRLSLDDKGAARLQGWATVENTSDEDWSNVKVGLVAGRPLSFQMDLYDPLFVPRPTVEPDLFASLRPPTYQGTMTSVNPTGMMGVAGLGNQAQNPGSGFGGGGQNGQLNNGTLNFNGGFGQIGNGQFGGGQFGNLGGQFGQIGNNFNAYAPRSTRPNLRDLSGSRLNYNDYVGRVKNPNATPGQAADKSPAVRDPFDPAGGVLAAAAAGRLGDSFQYAIADPVTLPRMKSAMLPIVSEAVEGARVSIFNPRVLAKHPLLGVKLVNKTKLHLAQGPATVYDGDTFAGDARLPDLKPNETRLISYAIDLGTEVATETPDGLPSSKLLRLQVADGNLRTTTLERKAERYLIRNRDTADRNVVVEHPLSNHWKLVAPAGKVERSRDYYRFEVVVKAGDLARLEVVEESEGGSATRLTSLDDDLLGHFNKQTVASPAVKAVLAKVKELRDAAADVRRGLDEEQAALKEIGEDQSRIRQNVDRVPRDSDAYKRYLKKFDDQETEIERRQARVKELKAALAKADAGLKAFVEGAKAE